jgi:hypothetical protein
MPYNIMQNTRKKMLMPSLDALLHAVTPRVLQVKAIIIFLE